MVLKGVAALKASMTAIVLSHSPVPGQQVAHQSHDDRIVEQRGQPGRQSSTFTQAEEPMVCENQSAPSGVQTTADSSSNASTTIGNAGNQGGYDSSRKVCHTSRINRAFGSKPQF